MFPVVLMKKNLQICWVSNPQTFTVKTFLIFYFVFHTQLALAQVAEDFSDHDFYNSPSWFGDDSQFSITDDVLQLTATGEGTASLWTANTLVGHAIWEFNVRLDFNPSSSNHARIYLTSDQSNLNLPLRGYFVQVGSREDDVSLFQQSGTETTKIIDGRDGILNLSSVSTKIKIIHDDSGWTLFTAIGPTDVYTLEGSSEANEMHESAYFGIACYYTATRSDKFFFDNIYIRENTSKDETPPTVINIDVVSSMEIAVTFSEPVDPRSVDISNFTILPDQNPIGASLNETQTIVSLQFSKPFNAYDNNVLQVAGLSDQSGNTMALTQKEFTFEPPLQVLPKDIVISEIFADPSPTIGLPEVEYIEIYNRTDKSIRLNGWQFMDETTASRLPDLVLHPKDYLVLTSHVEDFDASNVVAIQNFPALNNSGDALWLKDDRGTVIDSLVYTDAWYKDEGKLGGGWSLEIIDTENLCSGNQNWAASENDTGGTPGTANSIAATKPDVTGPKLLSAIPLTSSMLVLQFNERLDKQLPRLNSIIITPAVGIKKLAFSNTALTSLQVEMEESFQAGTKYNVNIGAVYDCAGNKNEEANETTFGLPEEADSLDVLINEILFNPRPTGVDFVEIVNSSSKFLNLKNWSLGTLGDDGLQDIVTITTEDLLLQPRQILAFTINPEILLGEYLNANEKNVVAVKKLPSFNDDAGNVAILDHHGNVIDFFTYTKDMHSVFIKDEEGVSLERITAMPNSLHAVWKSATASTGFATPGYMNSNNVDVMQSAEPIKIEPEIFSPLMGTPTFTLVHYNFESGGYVGNVQIFDSQGRVVKSLANNNLLGTSGFFRWDGDSNDGTKVPVGYYMDLFEIFDDRGVTKRYQKRVAVATSF